MKFELHLVSSQFKHLAGRREDDLKKRTVSRGSALKNEAYSIQALYRVFDDTPVPCHPISIAVRAAGLCVESYRVDFVPVTQAANLFREDGFEGNNPGLYPDVLQKRPAAPEIEKRLHGDQIQYFEKDTDVLLNATQDYQSLWITLNSDECASAGIYPITVTATSLLNGEVFEEKTFALQIINASLPEQKEYYTNWIYEDAVCDTYGVDLYGDEFYQIFDQLVTNAVKHRQNTILLPAFTPPLDTSVGDERRNVQLTDIAKTEESWMFSFGRMKKFIDHAKECGIKFFEHSHIFSQWGAKHAPNIYDTAGNRIFGRETDASGKEYTEFIRAYLKAFLRFAKEEGIDDSLIFHISDEPALEHIDSYRAAVESISDLLREYPIADALSHAEYFSEGLVKQPVAFIDRADEFEALQAPFLVYYTGGPHHKRATNRLISNTAARTRVLGLQMYRYRASGFLHWGYNYYYDRMTHGIYNPLLNPCGYKQYPGAAHLVYPSFSKGIFVLPSIREKHMAEAFDDLRALNLLESMVGRKKVLELCQSNFDSPIDCRLIPAEDQLCTMRERINDVIAKNL